MEIIPVLEIQEALEKKFSGSSLKSRYSKSSTTTKVIIWIVIILIIVLLIWWIIYAIRKASQISTENPVIISSPIDAWQQDWCKCSTTFIRIQFKL